MPDYGLSPCAWTPRYKQNPKNEWIGVSFDRPIHVQQIAIAENANPGTIFKVFLIDSNKHRYPVFTNDWKNRDLGSKKYQLVEERQIEFDGYHYKLQILSHEVYGKKHFGAVLIRTVH